MEEEKLESDRESFEFCESHCMLDLDMDGFSEPYIAVVCKENDMIVAEKSVKNWNNLYIYV